MAKGTIPSTATRVTNPGITPEEADRLNGEVDQLLGMIAQNEGIVRRAIDGADFLDPSSDCGLTDDLSHLEISDPRTRRWMVGAHHEGMLALAMVASILIRELSIGDPNVAPSEEAVERIGKLVEIIKAFTEGNVISVKPAPNGKRPEKPKPKGDARRGGKFRSLIERIDAAAEHGNQ